MFPEGGGFKQPPPDYTSTWNGVSLDPESVLLLRWTMRTLTPTAHLLRRQC